jgi:hypothetical protein
MAGYDQKTLTLHIGAHKTGTTVLQSHVFPTFSGYLGKYANSSSTPYHQPSDIQIQLEKSWREVYRHWLLGSKQLQSEVAKWVTSLSQLEQPHLLLSAEELHSWPTAGNRAGNFLSEDWFASNQSEEHPVMGLLREIKWRSSEKFKVRVMMTLRNQPDYLGSWYAQAGSNFRGPGQADFESRMSRLLARRDPYLDWVAQVESLNRILGKSNVLILLFEDGLEHNALRMAEFLGAEFEVPSSLPKENVKVSGENRWSFSVAGLHREGPSGQLFWFAFTRLPFSNKVRSWARLLFVLVESFVERVFPNRQRHVSILMSDPLRESISDYFSDSNKRLALVLGRNLEVLGY